MIKSYILILLILVNCSFVKGQEWTSLNEGDVIIEGVIDDQTWKESPEKLLNLTIQVSDFPGVASLTSNVVYTKEVKNGETFKFAIPAPADRFYVKIDYTSALRVFHWNLSDNIYILEKGDRINCRLTDDNFEFTGKGSEKLNLQSQLYQVRHIKNKSDPHPNQRIEYLAFHDKIRDSILKVRLDIVEKYSGILGRELTNIMKANCYGLKNYLKNSSQGFRPKEEDRRIFFNSEGYKDEGSIKLKNISPKELIAAPLYTNNLFLYLNFANLDFQVHPDNGEVLNKERLFYTIVNNYKGLMRQQLLTTYLLYNKNAVNNTKQLAILQKLLKNENYKQILINQIDERGINVPFYPFKMEDDKGKWVSLDDFKDEVVLIDFWYTGCVNCSELTKNLSPVFEKFKNHPRMKFVSVSIDASKQEWLESIARGKYTHEGSINLYAGGHYKSTFDRHPLISRYKIKAYPTIFLIKKGMMYSTSLPHKDNAKLINIIEKALAEE